jgi:hypothetical protein
LRARKEFPRYRCAYASDRVCDFYTGFSDAFYGLDPKQLKQFQNSNRIRRIITQKAIVIEIESTLYTCTSCQKFLQAAKIYGNSENKILEIKFIAHPDADMMGNVKNMIKE